MVFKLSSDENKIFGGEINAPASKSYMHRLIIAAALSDEETIIKNATDSDDISATLKSIKMLGGDFSFNDSQLTIFPIKKNKVKAAEINCFESGSTLRFMLPISTALGKTVTFDGKGKLPQRPIFPLDRELSKNGVTFKMPEKQGDIMPFQVTGSLKSGEFILSGDVSSQFVSGLLFALPLLFEKSKIVLTSPLQSKPYVDMTIRVLKQFKIKVKETENGYEIEGGQSYVSPRELICEGDWSAGAFFLCAGALGGSVKINGLSTSSLQGDKEVYYILKKMGAKLESGKNYVTVKKSKLKAIDIDARQIPDLVPILALTLSLSNGESEIYNAERLRIKESDRLNSTRETLSALGAEIEEKEASLKIKGKESLKGGFVSSFNDHRIAMTSAIASLFCEGSVEIENPMCVKKSYPKFYEDFCKLGGKKDVISMGE